MRPRTEKLTIIVLCVLGVSGVAYGMGADNDIIFVMGILFVIVGYLLIRRKLKHSVRKR